MNTQLLAIVILFLLATTLFNTLRANGYGERTTTFRKETRYQLASTREALARTSHQLSTAANDASYPDVFSHHGVLNVLQSTPPRPMVRKPAWPRRLVALVTIPGEKCGLAEQKQINQDLQLQIDALVAAQNAGAPAQ